ncbi:cupredoxin domain-containing protein [Romeriopsis navalis]|nr:cupredoxin domain-containing protein [Romeriopsis navalis]
MSAILLLTSSVHAREDNSINSQQALRSIEQPLSRKVIITLAGIGLIGTELWWFLGKSRQVQQADSSTEIQTQTIIVDGGYQPDTVVVQAGKPVHLRFQRQDSNSCLDQILLPDFGVQLHLTMNEITTVKFTPTEPGEYAFTCGMQMFRGTVVVQ